VLPEAEVALGLCSVAARGLLGSGFCRGESASKRSKLTEGRLLRVHSPPKSAEAGRIDSPQLLR
jgi:hypothetical protein